MMKKIQEAVPYQLRKLYREWLLEIFEDLEEKDIPIKGRLKPGIRFPEPSGEKWRSLCDGNTNKAARRAEAEKEQRVIDHMVQALFIQETVVMKAFKGEQIYDNKVKKVIKRKFGKKRRSKAVQAGQEKPPNTLSEAFTGEHAHKWVKAADEEMDGLTEQGVVEHDFTLKDLENAGVEVDANTHQVKPIPMSVVLDHKYSALGLLDRRKVRLAISGHAGNMQKGVHFSETFAAAPNPNTARLLQALCVLKGYQRMSFDIKQAYTRSELPPGKLIALKYPIGYRRKNDKGEELYMLLKKNLYGHPAAARAWAKTRDQFLLEEFNKNGWSCERTMMDSCVFRFTKENEEVIALIHTDDVDMIGSNEEMLKEIFQKCDKKWECKEVSSEFILGIKRVRQEDKKTKEDKIQLTMTAFIEGLYKDFGSYCDPGKVDTPFPVGSKGFISKGEREAVSDEESRKYLDMGFQRLCGCLLWAARNVYCECMCGISFLCRLMSRPNERAWKAALHMVKWLYQERERGIVFSSKGNAKPIAYSDASNESDPADGKAQSGYCIMLAGAPVVWGSSKLKHVSPTGSAAHVEYMALSQCNQGVYWLRQLLEELECDDMINEATIVYGDNNVANNLVKEHFTSTGNQYIYLPYHWQNELSELGIIEVHYKRSKWNLADLYTKPVDGPTIRRLVGRMCGYQDFTVPLENEGV